MKRVIWSAIVASWALPAAALAAAAPTQSTTGFAVGTAVVDESGNPVGHIEAVRGADLLVRTDRHQARIPRSSFRHRQGRLVLNMTRAQLNAAIDRMAPDVAPPVQIEPGVAVRGAGGAIAGTIESVGQDHVILRLTSGERVRLPRSGVGTNAEGAFITVTTAELLRLAEAASGSASD